MLKKIFDILFGKRNQELITELKKNSSFRTNEEVSKSSKNSELTKSGTIICEIENEKVTMELESYVSGKVIFTHALNQKIKPNTEICIIEGI